LSESIKILIVEDEILIARDIKEALEELNYSVCDFAPSVERALEIIEAEKPDIALIDIKLKGKETGIDLGKILLEKDTIPFIYLTSHTDALTLSESKNTRPSGYLVKPFKQNDVHIALEIALNNFAHRKIDISHSPQEFVKSGTPFKIRKVINYINENVDTKMQLVDLAALAQMSTFHFSRTFKSYIKLSPANYITKIKIEKSKGLLSDTDLNILQIALEVGFENQSYFSQVFKKEVGNTPEQYRNISFLKKNNSKANEHNKN
jgi:YesN/AraC family two-component response regulator